MATAALCGALWAATAAHAQTTGADQFVSDLSQFTRSPVTWTSGASARAMPGGAVERFSFAAPRGDTVEARHALRMQGPSALEGYALAYSREWPLKWDGGLTGYDVEIAPRAGFGVASFGRSAEAGAEIRIGELGGVEDRLRQGLSRVGVDARAGSAFGGQGRWYLFAAASGKAVGLNLRRDEAGWSNAGWSEDRTSGFIASAQAGVAWRKGPAQASLGYVRRKIKLGGPQSELFADLPKSDHVAGFTFSYAPR